ncbi:ABC transporter ATP-binding protein [Lacticaseibacillus sharpeae]|uniref:ABC transporter ATP-binding protein n=1 Tax=Lacticaseibacillus sharpeae TaxID=1626 RepID=UPI0006D14F19|nr:ABC transporter ATP-binding protein [Lacticaseibacillus sharpeae]
MTKKNEKIQRGSLISLLKMSRQSNTTLFISLVTSVISAAFMLIAPLGLKGFINGEVGEKSGLMLMLAIGGLVIQGLFQALSYYSASAWAEKKVMQLRDEITQHTLRLKITNPLVSEPSKLASIVVNNSETVRLLVSDTLPELVSGVLIVIGGFVLLIILSWQLTVFLLLTLLILMVVINLVSRSMARISHRRQSWIANYISEASTFIAKLATIKALNGEGEVQESVEKITKSLHDLGLKASRISACMGPLILTSTLVSFLSVFAVGGYLVNSGLITLGGLVTFLIYLFQIISPLTSLGNSLNKISAANGAADKLIDVLVSDTENDGINVQAVPSKIGGNLELKNVSFAYEGRKVLDDVSISVPANTNVAIVGPSGAGKSTIISVIERFITPSHGELAYGAHNACKIGLHQWRENIGYVAQTESVVGKTVKEALLFGLVDKRDAESRITEIIKLVGLQDEIGGLEKGIDTQIVEGGTNFSGGQIQRLMIARALIRKPKILLLDEATSSLDADSEASIVRIINKLKHEVTVITIAHRLSTIKNADKIYFLEQGRITGVGTHDEMIHSHEVYARYVAEQTI